MKTICERCQGSGNIRKIIGTGTVIITSGDKTSVPIEGTFKAERKCPNCKGSGKVKIFTDTTICPRCKKPIEYKYVENGGVLPSKDYDLIADVIFHSECWNKLVEENSP